MVDNNLPPFTGITTVPRPNYVNPAYWKPKCPMHPHAIFFIIWHDPINGNSREACLPCVHELLAKYAQLLGIVNDDVAMLWLTRQTLPDIHRHNPIVSELMDRIDSLNKKCKPFYK